MTNTALSIIAGLGAFLAIGVLTLFDMSFDNLALVMAPFGATAVLVFGLPDSPLAKTKNVVFGHLIAGAIGVVFVQFVGVSPLTLAIATGLAVSAMLMTKTTHPPAGANPLLIMLTNQSWEFLFTPILLGALIIVFVGKSVNVLRKQWLIVSR